MLGFIKKANLNAKQKTIQSKYPGVSITLHPDMPNPSVGKMVEIAGVVAAVNACEKAVAALSDEALRAKTADFKNHILQKSNEVADQMRALEDELSEAAIPEEKERIKEKIKLTRNKIFDDILPEAFAVVREASKRTIGLRHFDVQIAGGYILHEGKIAEMSTGEGKTLVATLPTYLNALLGKGVHIVTVNDYLARRDREWMGPIFEFLGLSIGAIQHEMSDEQRQREYACDITYGTNNEFGFDYLRDNMKYSVQDLVQRPFYYAIVDEVDSILIDEARTPLIISGPAEEATDKYYIVDRIIPKLKRKKILEKEEIDAKYKGEDIAKGFDAIVDEKTHTARLTEEGETKACQLLNIADLHTIENTEWLHHIIQAMRAHDLYQKDVQYVVRDGQVIIVDEFTGRLMPGRRWSDGLHQAVEAKEGIKIERENQTLATITFQNYFRMYEKLAGMTGTAYTEANEFKAIYKLDVVVIPTNRPLVRVNTPDQVYKTEAEKFAAVVEEIVALHAQGRPVLVGTISIEKSERLGEMLKRRGVTHQVLNAKYHEMEAAIVAQAGRFKGVTIATNMAGRGTDILLGGNPAFMARNVLRQKMQPEDLGYQDEYKKLFEKFKAEAQEEHEKVVRLGGLHVIGTERHEARRIDNQLRGRCARQGDPGSSKFYVSLADDLMRLFGSDKLIGVMNTLGLEEGQVIEHPWVTRSIEIAQKRVETHNFDIRKQLLEYDNVMNKQREVIYMQRRQILEGASLKDDVLDVIDREFDAICAVHCADSPDPHDWNVPGFVSAIGAKFSIELNPQEILDAKNAQVKENVRDALIRVYTEREKSMGEEVMRHMERMVYLQVVDAKWKDHLYAMDLLREGIGLRAYGQRDPLIEYKREAFGMFSEMVASIGEEAVQMIFRLQPVQQERFKGAFSSVVKHLVHQEAEQFSSSPVSQTGEGTGSAEQTPAKQVPVVSGQKVGRNDPCPCGSGKKYKKCCGQ
ncbi:MAG TPA: preprotein translocase subunit SecA [Candidatus Omnitrophota bacterium]|nr:preprotein translocase subunit SecA [Candidatus Omnitrophota bacterium]